jgi:catechol 2,3-dioxygenase-like lactoylglutathione lyase family enzyme
MKINGILETSLYVADPGRSAAFYRRLFDFPTLLEEDRLVALGVAGHDVLLLFRRGTTEEPVVMKSGVIGAHGSTGQSHLAFAIEASELEAWKNRLAAEGVAVESTVDWPRGAHSVYFRDPDNHLLELVTPGVWSVY